MHLECSRLDFLKPVYDILGLSFYLIIMVVEIFNRCDEFFCDFTIITKPLTFVLSYCVVLVMFHCLAQVSDGTGKPPHLNFCVQYTSI